MTPAEQVAVFLRAVEGGAFREKPASLVPPYLGASPGDYFFWRRSVEDACLERLEAFVGPVDAGFWRALPDWTSRATGTTTAFLWYAEQGWSEREEQAGR